MNTHYRDGLYRLLHARGWGLIFFSDGREWYAEQAAPVDHLGATPMRGLWILGTRIVPGIPFAIARSQARAVVKDANGRFTLPAAYLAARLTRKRFILWTAVWREPRTRAWAIGRPLLHRMLRGADAVLTYGPHVSSHVRTLGVSNARIFEAVQSVDNARFAVGRARSRSGPLDVLVVARLVPEKGVSWLLEAMALLDPDVAPIQLTVAGEGPLETELKRQCADSGLERRVRFVGRVAQSEMPTLYARSDVVVLPSLSTSTWTEPWGLVMNEAMASGAAVIASDAVGAAAGGLVQDLLTGLVVPAGDAEALASALRRLSDDPQLRARLAAAGADRVSELTYPAMAVAFESAVAYAMEHPRRDRRRLRRQSRRGAS